jgi:hypothetical protein
MSRIAQAGDYEGMDESMSGTTSPLENVSASMPTERRIRLKAQTSRFIVADNRNE